MPNRLPLVLGFAWQVIIGSTLFAFVYVVALVLAWSLHHVSVWLGAPSWLEVTAAGIEIAIWALDMLCFLLFLAIEALSFVRSLIGEGRGTVD